MAREVKPVQLRTVDDDAAEASPVVRLENRETGSREREAKPVRLGPAQDDKETSRRLDLPAKEEVELRTHQPGIELLIEPESPPPELLEENWGEATVYRNPIPWGWFVLIGLAIASAVIWSLTRVEKADKQADKLRKETANAIVDDQKEDKEAAQLIDRIQDAIHEFFNATTVKELSKLIRHEKRVEPLMRRYYSDNPVFAGRFKAIRILQPLTLDNRGNFWMASVALGDGGKRSLIIEIDPSGKPLIDWETMVCYQPMKWDDFVTKRPTGTSMDFRVYMERDNFYSHEFSDSSHWMSFRLTALDSDETLFGYVAVGSPQAAQLMKSLENSGGRPATLILRLQIPEGLQSHRGAVIEEVVSSRWLYLDSPDSGS